MFVKLQKLRILFVLFIIIQIFNTAAKCVPKPSENEATNSTRAKSSIMSKLDRMTELLEQQLEYQKMNFWANLKYYHCQTLSLQLCVKYFQEASTTGKVQL